MDSQTFEERMRRGEMYHNLRVLDGAHIVIRVDGRGFSKLTRRQGFAKPFDERFRDHMLAAAEALVREFQATYAYTQSDEISVLLPRETTNWGREVEKLVSLSAAVASVAFSRASGLAGHFDARLWVGVDPQAVVDYFSWRMADAERNSLQGAAYWALRARGQGRGAATARLAGLGQPGMHDLLHGLGLNWNDLPAWQRRGCGFRRVGTTRTGHNPVTGQDVVVTRSALARDLELPYGDAYRELVRGLVTPEEEAVTWQAVMANPGALIRDLKGPSGDAYREFVQELVAAEEDPRD